MQINCTSDATRSVLSYIKYKLQKLAPTTEKSSLTPFVPPTTTTRGRRVIVASLFRDYLFRRISAASAYCSFAQRLG